MIFLFPFGGICIHPLEGNHQMPNKRRLYQTPKPPQKTSWFLAERRLRKKAEEKRSGRCIEIPPNGKFGTSSTPNMPLKRGKCEFNSLEGILYFCWSSFLKNKWSEEKDWWCELMEQFGVSFPRIFLLFILWIVVFPCVIFTFSAWCLSKKERTIGTAFATHVPSNKLKSYPRAIVGDIFNHLRISTSIFQRVLLEP